MLGILKLTQSVDDFEIDNHILLIAMTMAAVLQLLSNQAEEEDTGYCKERNLTIEKPSETKK
jgi:hypothetical protein